ncbi:MULTISPECIES: beta-N-acetylhexosaminidase [Streptomyces]|uniref:beta-N-acetylhexosaminidase n=1 Tax=Streptomyces TaxID=1883 RepID=UPI00025CD4A4|nr:beta-N-acetylhexosaminidase [Streptomyces tsukubensis]AZK94173.1 beta-N-acetylhexosaminidase [Streptomyces tsukubensis]EIF89863.1 beta-N-acetylhexosaminidase [Streptomyces tsukubensis NRRL18488]
MRLLRPRPGPLRAPRRPGRRLLGVLLLTAVAGTGCFGGGGDAGSGEESPRRPPVSSAPLGNVVPAPASVRPSGPGYTLAPAAAIRVDDRPAVRAVGDYLAAVLRPSTGYRLPVTPGAGTDGIQLRLDPARRDLGAEGYRLTSSQATVSVVAREPAGLFRGVQTLRQLLPPAVEMDTRQTAVWRFPGGTITDTPRYAYRGAMLDVARHFFTVAQVKRYIDQLALYKINKLHLHLTDDQGWRIAIDSRPKLTTVGAATAVGGGKGGFYTKAQYREIVAYAASRHMDVIPEIGMPGHTAAAIASYPELSCHGFRDPVHTGVDTGFSSLCVGKEETYDFVEDVIRELAAMTPGEYLHIGGDEADSTSKKDYRTFMNRVREIVAKHGKKVMAWHEIAGAGADEEVLAQYWGTDRTEKAERKRVADAVKKGTKLILSPADRVYLDMQYTYRHPLGLSWAGRVEVDRSYDWDPARYLKDVGVPDEAVLGVEAPIWTETLVNSAQLEQMAFPRLLGVAEKGWSGGGIPWAEYEPRLAAQAGRMSALGIAFHRSPTVAWPKN